MSALVTQHLLGERPALAHLEEILCLLRDPRVATTLGGLRSRPQVEQVLERFMGSWVEMGYGPFVFRLRADGSFVGYGGVIETRAILLEGVELLYAIRPEYWNRGLATEFSAACIEMAFSEHRLPEIIAFTTNTHLASRRVMEKNGFVYEKDFDYVGLPHALYRLTRLRHQEATRKVGAQSPD